MCFTCKLLISALLASGAISPADRKIEEGVEQENLARLDRGVEWTASESRSKSFNAAQVLNGEVCDESGRDGYWAGIEGQLPATLEITFPRPTTVDTNLIVWYTTDIRGVNYKLEGLTTDGKWVELYNVGANRHRDVVHRFASRTVTKVRLTLVSTAGQNRVVMREFLLYQGLTAAEEKILMANAARCLGANERSRQVELGVAVKAVVFGNSQGTIGPSPEGGHPIFYTSYYNTGGAELVAYDHKAKKVYRWDIPGTSGCYGLTAGLDGRIYMGTVEGQNAGCLMQFDPIGQTIRNLGNAGQPTKYIWSCATGPDGEIFAAGYPNCIPLIYDPNTDELTSPGSIRPRPGAEYLRSVAADAKGRAWFGVSTRGALVVYDPADGSRRDVLPEKYAKDNRTYNVIHAGPYIHATLLPSGVVLVFDAESCEFLREIPVPQGEMYLLNHVSDSKGNDYCSSTPSGHLYVIRPGESHAEKVFPYLGVVKSVLEDRYLHATFDNDHLIFDLTTKKVVDRHRWIEPRTGMGIYCLTQGPQGDVYGSTYINQHFFRYDTGAGKLEDMGRIIRYGGQCDSMCASRDGRRLWMGCYGNAHVAMYDPTKPYKIGTETDCNPRNFGPIGKGQYRTRAIVEGPRGKIYCGSVPSYNTAPTGAFTIFDPETLKKKVMTDFVPGGTVNHLAASDRYVYGSGGGELFVLNPASGEKLKTRTLTCGPMLLGADGKLVVSAPGAVQGLDPETLETSWTVPLSQIENLTEFLQIAKGPTGEMYGISKLGIFRVDVEAAQLVQLTRSGSRHLAADKEGRLYYSQNASLYMYDPRGTQ